jgi:GNAT superfamily N-acetyltransferase
MRVIRLVCRHPRQLVAPPALGNVAIRAACIDRDGQLVTQLAAATAAEGPPASPAATGLLAELASRPNRRVEAWLAVSAAADQRPLGLVSLVTSRGSDRATTRYSLGWLLVHPGFRRLGVGRQLVAHACRRAWTLGAGEVWVETRTDWTATMGFWAALGFTRPSAGRGGA